MFEKPPTTESVPDPEDDKKPRREVYTWVDDEGATNEIQIDMEEAGAEACLAHLRELELAGQFVSLRAQAKRLQELQHRKQEGYTESIPTEAEIEELFNRLLDGREYTDRRKLEDEFGIYLWEIETAMSEEEKAMLNEPEGTKEYAYTRKGPHAAGNPTETTIKSMYFDVDGMPLREGTSGRIKDGEWKFFEETQ